VILGFEEYITVMLGVSVGVTAGVLLLPIFMMMLTPEMKARVGGGSVFWRCGERRQEGLARCLMVLLKGVAAACAAAPLCPTPHSGLCNAHTGGAGQNRINIRFDPYGFDHITSKLSWREVVVLIR